MAFYPETLPRLLYCSLTHLLVACTHPRLDIPAPHPHLRIPLSYLNLRRDLASFGSGVPEQMAQPTFSVTFAEALRPQPATEGRVAPEVAIESTATVGPGPVAQRHSRTYNYTDTNAFLRQTEAERLHSSPQRLHKTQRLLGLGLWPSELSRPNKTLICFSNPLSLNHFLLPLYYSRLASFGNFASVWTAQPTSSSCLH